MDTERVSVSAVRPALAAACPSLTDGIAADAVAGVVPSFVASPSSTAEVSALLREAAAAGLAVVPRGAGTGLAWGAPPSRCDLVVDLRSMDQVVEHEAGDLVARVQAGATIGQLAVAFGSAGQQLALDTPEEATVGGVVATGTAGPRRFRYGAPRDLLIGITVVRADGVVAHAGGKVVKNVAGYDLGKLFAGSQGTLGVITEAAFRLHPLPAAVAWVTAEFGPAERAGAVTAAAAAARRGAARGHRARGSRTRQADVRAAGGARRGGVGRRDGARPLGCAAVVSDDGPGLVLGERASPGAGRGGRGGRGRRGQARGERPGRRGRAVRLPGSRYLGRGRRPVRDRVAGTGRGRRVGGRRSPRWRGRADGPAGRADGDLGRDRSRPGPDAGRRSEER